MKEALTIQRREREGPERTSAAGAKPRVFHRFIGPQPHLNVGEDTKKRKSDADAFIPTSKSFLEYEQHRAGRAMEAPA
jgi:hypothetical protein